MSELEGTRTCIKCGAVKPESLFKRDRNLPSGITNVCKKCASVKALEYYYRVKPHRMKFKDTIFIMQKPRKGICEICGAVRKPIYRQFAMHHDKYDPDNPEAYTRELCQSCHGKLHAELRRLAKTEDN